MNIGIVNSMKDTLVEFGGIINKAYIDGIELLNPSLEGDILLFTYPDRYDGSEKDPESECIKDAVNYMNYLLFIRFILNMLPDLEDVEIEYVGKVFENIKKFCCSYHAEVGKVRYKAIRRNDVWTVFDREKAVEKAERHISKFKEGLDDILEHACM